LHDQGKISDKEFRRAKRQAGLGGNGALKTVAALGVAGIAIAMLASAGDKKS